MAQGIMTGIGFLGAGVIFREGLTVRGLTTAASIWVTSAVGILIGIGLYPPALMTTAAALGVLASFRWIERRLPRELYADHVLRFEPAAAPPEGELRRLLADSGFVIANLSYGLVEHGRFYE
jgi:putative Mg2+ transporter-C (MgtC) family protein